jgi:hypothetical protein
MARPETEFLTGLARPLTTDKTSSAPAFLRSGYRQAPPAHLHIDVCGRSNEETRTGTSRLKLRYGVIWQIQANVRPCVERNPPCRDESIVQGSQISPSREYEVMVSGSLFFSCFSTRIRFAVRKYHGCGHAVDRPVDSVDRRFSCSPLLYHGYWPVSEFRYRGTKLLSGKNMAPRFEDTEHKETCMPSLSGQSGRYTKRQAS